MFLEQRFVLVLRQTRTVDLPVVAEQPVEVVRAIDGGATAQQTRDVGEGKVREGRRRRILVVVLDPHDPREVAGRTAHVDLTPHRAPAVTDARGEDGRVGRLRSQTCNTLRMVKM